MTGSEENKISRRTLFFSAFLLFFACACRLLAQNAELGAPIIRSYKEAQVGSDSSSWIVKQGPDGSLYFGCDSLEVFDGERWRQFPANGAPDIRGIDFAGDGKIWSAALGEIGWFQREFPGEWKYHSLNVKLPAEHSKLGNVWHTFTEGKGALFISTDNIIRWDGKEMHVWPLPDTRRLPAMRVGDHVYIHHFPTGLYVMTETGPTVIIPANILGKAAILWMEQQDDGFLMATSEGLLRYSKQKIVPFAPELSAYIRKNVLTSAVRLSDGRLAIGTYQGGIVFSRRDGSIESVLTEKDGIPTSSIFSLFLDHEKDLWATSGSVIFQISLNSRSSFFGAGFGLPNQPVLDIARYDGRINLISDGTVFERDLKSGKFQALESIPRHVWELQPIAGALMVGGLNGVFKRTTGEVSRFHTTSQDNSVILPSRQSPENILISEGENILELDPQGSSRTAVQNLPEPATSLAEDVDRRLWIGTEYNGVFFAKLSPIPYATAFRAPVEYGLPSGNGPGRVVAGADGTVLAFTAANGFTLKPGAKMFSPIQGYPARGVNAVSEVLPDGTLWVVHPAAENRSATAARISIKDGHAIWQPHSVDGLWSIGTPKCILAEPDTDGKVVLWIGGSTGVLRTEVIGGPAAPAPRPPLLRALARISDATAPQPITQPLDYSTRGIVFEFAAPEFARRPALHLETMLEGVDENWVPADATSRRELTALREGKYNFRVRAVAETGVASREAVSHFEIKPPWWRTATALVCVLLALIPAGYGVYLLRVRSLRQRNAELEAKVHERTAQLAQASAAKTQFIASMSHDIRNPLNGIVGLSLALEDTKLSPKQSELISTLRECTSYLSTLVDDVLDFASIEAGRIELRPASFSPQELLQSIATMLRTEAIASGATLSVESDPNLPAAYVGDAGRIQQILLNYVSNALKYSGGRIKLTASIPPEAGEEIEFAVTDHGPGISEKDQSLLFTKFTRLTDSQSKEITGTGLGLASCKLLAGLMGGSVGVHSSRGAGARFFLRLPLDVAPATVRVVASPPSAAIVPTLPNCSVLVVEDTNYNALAAAAVLAKFGLKSEWVSTGAEALRAFSEKRHNLVLLDRNLPDMDGTEVARRIREIEGDGPRAIMLAVTAYCTTEDRALCLNAGMDAFVGKPLTPEKLRRVLIGAGRRHLAAASMNISLSAVSTEVDVSLLQYISDGTDQGLSRQVELFLTALGEAEKQLNQTAESGDYSVLGKAAHVVLSHARLVGSSSLAAAAADLEHAARTLDPHALGDLLQRVNREIQVLTTTVRRYPGAPRTK